MAKSMAAGIDAAEETVPADGGYYYLCYSNTQEVVTVKATTVTKKGQVTIPKEIREILGILPHDRVRFEVRDDAVILRREATADTSEIDRMLQEFVETGKVSESEPAHSPLDFAGDWKDADFVDEMIAEIYERRKQSGRRRRKYR